MRWFFTRTDFAPNGLAVTCGGNTAMVDAFRKMAEPPRPEKVFHFMGGDVCTPGSGNAPRRTLRRVCGKRCVRTPGAFGGFALNKPGRLLHRVDTIPALSGYFTPRGLLRWSGVDKCLLMGGLHLASRSSLVLIFLRMTRHPEQYPYMEPVWTARFLEVFAGLWAVWLVMVLVGVLLRTRRPESGTYIHLTIILYWLTVGIMSWGWGLWNGPFWMAALGSAVLSLILWGPPRTWEGVGAAALFLLAALGAERLGWVRYAPLLQASPVGADGRLDVQFLGIMAGSSLTVFVLALTLTHLVVREWRDHQAVLEQLSSTDVLTGLHNRRWFRDSATRELDLARRHGMPVALLFMDVDHFKQVNDQHGHHAGDEALVTVGRSIRSCLRSVDLVARYGGEEFACLLTHTAPEGAAEVAERCRLAIAQAPVTTEKGTFHITVTVGVAPCSGDKMRTLDELIRAADGAMYKGKMQGRNRSVMAA